MADNVTITEGSGTQIAADEVAGVKHQRIKMTLGADGVSDGDVSSSNPMPVNILNTDNVSVTESSLGVIQSLIQHLIGSMPLTYSSNIPKFQVIFSSDSTTNLVNLNSIPSSELVYAQQQSAYCSFLSGVIS